MNLFFKQAVVFACSIVLSILRNVDVESPLLAVANTFFPAQLPKQCFFNWKFGSMVLNFNKNILVLMQH